MHQSNVYKLSGHIYSQNGSPIISFQIIDIGIYTNSRIIAITTDFKIYFEYKNNENLVFYNDVYLGKIINNTTIVDDTHQSLGRFNRNNINNENRFAIELNGKPALLFKNSDKKNYREAPQIALLVNLITQANEIELIWVTALSIFESIYFGFEFTS